MMGCERLSALQANAAKRVTDMSWLPPRTIGARAEWSNAHPWLAGCYFGLVMSGFWALAFALHGDALLGLVFGLIASPPTALLFAFLAKRRFGERPDADQQPLPTRRRIWSRASDRFLTGMLIFGVVSATVSIVSLAIPSRTFSDLLGAFGGAWLATTAAAERRVRRRPN
jgi:hypothetical protein